MELRGNLTPRPFSRPYIRSFHNQISDPAIGQGSLLIQPPLVFAKSCVFDKQLAFSILCSPTGSLLANLRENFAEFLKDNSVITLVYATRPLVSVLVQLNESNIDPIILKFYIRNKKIKPIDHSQKLLNLRDCYTLTMIIRG